MNNKAIRKAMIQARHSDVKCAKVVAVVGMGEKPLFAIGNARCWGRGNKWSYHAEERALLKCRKMGLNPRVLSITVLRFLADGSLAMARPCGDCKEIVDFFGDCYYSKDGGSIAKY